jgi:hypothetical protein
MSRSRLLSRTVLCLVVMCVGNSLGQEAATHRFPQGATVASPERRVPTDVDKIVREFVDLLYPDWDNGAWDLAIAGTRSMNPNFGMASWSFAVLDAAQPVVRGFHPSATACHDRDECFNPPNLAKAKFVGRIYQRGTRVQAYEGSRPEIAQKNADLQQAIQPDSTLEDLQNRLATAGARYPPSKELEVRKHLEAEPIFAKYGFRSRSVQFCRSIGPSESRRVAMLWSAEVFSSRFQRRYVLIIEPFEGDITGLLAVRKAVEAGISCTP